MPNAGRVTVKEQQMNAMNEMLEDHKRKYLRSEYMMRGNHVFTVGQIWESVDQTRGHF
jgi:hypothetical protein